MQYLELPPELASGDFIRFIHEQMATEEGIKLRYTFSGSIYFERMKKLGLYSAQRGEITERINSTGLTDIYNTCLV